MKVTDNALESGLAIVANGDTHAAIARGQYVYIKNHSGLPEGLYKAATAIDTNGALYGNVYFADANGELNALKDQLAPATNCNEIVIEQPNVTYNRISVVKSGNTFNFIIIFTINSDFHLYNKIAQFTKYPIMHSCLFTIYSGDTYGSPHYAAYLDSNGDLCCARETIPAGIYSVFGTFISSV